MEVPPSFAPPFPRSNAVGVTWYCNRPDLDGPLIAVSRTGCSIAGLPVLTPSELMRAWPT